VKLRRSSSILSTVEESSAATGLASPCTAAALAAAAAAACRSCAVRPGTALARGRPRWPERRPHSRLGRPATEREVGRGLRRSRLPTSRSSNLRPAQRTPIPDRARLAPQLARELADDTVTRTDGLRSGTAAFAYLGRKDSLLRETNSSTLIGACPETFSTTSFVPAKIPF
jgi:hypothetical protein